MGRHILNGLKNIAIKEGAEDSELLQAVSDLFPKNKDNIIGLYMACCGLSKRNAILAYEDLCGRHADRMTRIYASCSHNIIGKRPNGRRRGGGNRKR